MPAGARGDTVIRAGLGVHLATGDHCETEQQTHFLMVGNFQNCPGNKATPEMSLGLPSALVVKNPSANAGDIRDRGSIPAWGRSPGRGDGNPLQYYCVENLMDRGAWWGPVCGVAKSRTHLSTYTYIHTEISFSKFCNLCRAWGKTDGIP